MGRTPGFVHVVCTIANAHYLKSKSLAISVHLLTSVRSYSTHQRLLLSKFVLVCASFFTQGSVSPQSVHRYMLHFGLLVSSSSSHAQIVKLNLLFHTTHCDAVSSHKTRRQTLTLRSRSLIFAWIVLEVSMVSIWKPKTASSSSHRIHKSGHPCQLPACRIGFLQLGG